MHVVKVFNDKSVVDTVESFGEVDHGHYNSVRFSFVNIHVNKVEESH